jgi:pimeloyl-ACP methyl ester carboxylesterase
MARKEPVEPAREPGTTIVGVQGIPVEVEIRGRGRPILLVHGWSADRRYMIADLEPVLSAVRGWQRIYFDLPGHGATPAPEWLESQDQMLAILQDLIDVVLPEGQFAVAGNSYGGFLTLALVRSIPERLGGAALLVPDLPDADGRRDLPEPVTIHADSAVFADLAPDEEWIPGALPVHERRMLDEIRAHDMPAYRVADWAFLARLEANYLLTGEAAYPGSPFERPSLILAGRQDARVGYRRATTLIDEFPRATLAVADLAGHHLGRIERPALFHALLRDWLERLEAQSAR